MSPIRVLPESLVNKIAAGEVIVRPASVVKELVENSIDAGATRILVELGNGCRDLRVADDGIGMDRADAQLALVRHATSKIQDFDDLYSLDTRGFRGEALASIAAVSRIQILTRQRGAVAGVRISAEGMGEPRIEPAGAPEGTDVRVRDLFFNTPARLKFMKSPAGELQAVLTTLTRQALIRSDLGFTVRNEGTVLFDLPPAQPWEERIAGLLGGTPVLENLLEVDETRHGVRVRGFLLRPALSRKDRRQQHFYVNGRPISSRGLSASLQEAYKGIIMVGRFPVCVLDLILPPAEVDVNVHPTKEEVRFHKEGMINGILYKVAHARLQAANLVPVADLEGVGIQGPGAGDQGSGFEGWGAGSTVRWLSHPGSLQGELLGPLPVEGRGESRADRSGTSPFDFTKYTGNLSLPSVPMPKSVQNVVAADRELEALERSEAPGSSGTTVADGPGVPVPEPAVDEGRHCSVRPLGHSLRRVSETGSEATAGTQDGRNVPNSGMDGTPWAFLLRGGMLPEPIGQVARCYIIAQTGNDLLLIDQHAAHERLLYLKFSEAQQEAPSQPLLIPVSIDVPAPAVAYMERLLPVFASLGLKVEPFGGTTFLVQSVPADLGSRIDPAAVVTDLLDDYEALGRVEQVDILRDRVITRMACRAAVKAGQALHLDEMRALIRDLAEARLGFTCPHGRPTMVLLTRDQLDRLFKRVV